MKPKTWNRIFDLFACTVTAIAFIIFACTVFFWEWEPKKPEPPLQNTANATKTYILPHYGPKPNTLYYYDGKTLREYEYGDEALIANPPDLTRDTLKALGLEFVCSDEKHTGKQVNMGGKTAWVPCTGIEKVKVAEHIRVEGGKR